MKRIFSILILFVIFISVAKYPAKKVTILSSETVQAKQEINNQPETVIIEQIEKFRIVPMRVTAYCPCTKCCGPSADGTTASGYKIRTGEALIAADKKFAFGTEMIIPGYNDNNPVKVLDRGGAIYGNRIDVFFSTHQQALNWGVKNLDVKIFLN